VRGGADPGGDDDVDPDVALLAEVGLAGVDPDPHPHDPVGWPGLALERALEVRRSEDRVARARKGEEHPVSGPVDLPSLVRPGSFANELAQAGPHRGEAPTQGVQETRRPLDVGEEHRHGPAGQEVAQIGTCGHVQRVYERP
jgi:hypothetical protein